MRIYTCTHNKHIEKQRFSATLPQGRNLSILPCDTHTHTHINSLVIPHRPGFTFTCYIYASRTDAHEIACMHDIVYKSSASAMQRERERAGRASFGNDAGERYDTVRARMIVTLGVFCDAMMRANSVANIYAWHHGTSSATRPRHKHIQAFPYYIRTTCT